MTSEPDSTSRRPPPTIDLKATEVGAEKPAAAAGDAAAAETDAASARSAGAGSARTHLTIALAGIAGGVIGAALIGSGLWFAGLIPPHSPPAAAIGAPAANDAAITDIRARLAKIESTPPAQPQQQQADPALTARLAAGEAAVKSLSDQLAKLNGHVDAVTGAAQDALMQAKAASAAAEAVKSAAQSAAQGGVARSDLDALNTRVAALEEAVKKLDAAAHQPRSADDHAARLTIVTEALRAAVGRGAPYQSELAAVKAVGADQNALAALEPFAAAGIPNASALANELAALVPALQQAAVPAANSDTFLGRLEANARNLVRITPVDAPVGDDPASVVTRIDVDAARGDIAAALTDIGKLPDAAKPVVATWAQKAQARQAAIAASQKLAADALAALAKPGPQ